MKKEIVIKTFQVLREGILVRLHTHIEVWRKQYPCIEAVKNDAHSFYCTCCMKKLSCKHMGIADVKRHVQGASHLKV